MNTVAHSGSDFYLALGDLSYTSGGEQSWCNTFKSKFNYVELIAGNHDTGESPGGNIDNYIRYCPFVLPNITRPVLYGTYGKQYYFDYPQSTPLARFIMIAPGVWGSINYNYSVGGNGYIFTENAINDARAQGIKWIIVAMHKNCISTGAKSCEVGTDIMNLLLQKKVDLILQSHDHNYQRSHQLRCLTINSFDKSCISDDGSDGTYTKGLGSVLIINGEFGQPLYSASSTDAEAGYFAKIDSTTFGITKYTVTATEIYAQYLRSAGGAFADSFAIRDSGGSTSTPTPAPVPDTIVPTVSITNPLNGSSVTRNSTVTLITNASDNIGVTKVEFYVNNSLICTDTTNPYACAWKVPGKRGATYAIMAKAYDAAGNTATHTIRVTAG
jgi:hypothetical protein